MNDSILRGFCQKCADEVVYDIEAKKWFHNGREQEEICGNADGIGFLSARQMKILNDYLTKMDDETFFGADYYRMSIDFTKMYGFDFEQLLNQNPFLVAKILKEAGENSKEENK